MSREFEYIPWLKFVIFFFFLPSLEKTFCKNKRKKEKKKTKYTYIKRFRILDSSSPLSKSHPLDTTTRFQTIRSATPGKEKKKKKFNLPAVQIDEDEAEERRGEKRKDFFPCEFSRTSRFILDKGEAPFGIISWLGSWLREIMSSSRRSRCCARHIRRMVANRRERPCLWSPLILSQDFFFDETDSLRSSSSSSSPCDDPPAR